MPLSTKKWDPAEAIIDEETARVFLEDAIKENDPRKIARVTEFVARALGMMRLAASIGIPAEALFDLVNPYDDAYDFSALRETVARLAEKLPSAKVTDAA